jgi:hypothetical protein
VAYSINITTVDSSGDTFKRATGTGKLNITDGAYREHANFSSGHSDTREFGGVDYYRTTNATYTKAYPQEITINNITYGELQPRRQQSIRNRYENASEEHRTFDKLTNDTVVRQYSNRPNWQARSVDQTKRSDTQLGIHSTILSSLREENGTIEQKNGTVTVRGPVEDKEIEGLYETLPKIEPLGARVPEPGTDTTTVTYQINSQTGYITDFNISRVRIIATEDNGTEEMVTTLSLNYQDHNSVLVNIPENVTSIPTPEEQREQAGQPTPTEPSICEDIRQGTVESAEDFPDRIPEDATFEEIKSYCEQ